MLEQPNVRKALFHDAHRLCNVRVRDRVRRRALVAEQHLRRASSNTRPTRVAAGAATRLVVATCAAHIRTGAGWRARSNHHLRLTLLAVVEAGEQPLRRFAEDADQDARISAKLV